MTYCLNDIFNRSSDLDLFGSRLEEVNRLYTLIKKPYNLGNLVGASFLIVFDILFPDRID